MARIVEVVVETGKDVYGCFMSKESDDLGFGLSGMGKTAKAAIDDFYLAYDEMKTYCKEEGKTCPELEFKFVFDVGAFFSYYPINISAFAKYVGINASLLRQYATGLKTPKAKSLARIKQGIIQFKQDIDAGSLIDRPVLQYV